MLTTATFGAPLVGDLKGAAVKHLAWMRYCTENIQVGTLKFQRVVLLIIVFKSPQFGEYLCREDDYPRLVASMKKQAS